MHHHAYDAVCQATPPDRRGADRDHAADAGTGGPPRRAALTLFSLALGTFAIGSGEFGTNGIVPLLARDLHTSVPTATAAVTAYAIGVVVGSPLITVAAARLNRRSLLLGLMVLFIAGNLLSAAAPGIWALIPFRFVTGTVQGAYFGAAAVVASTVYGRGRSGKAFATVMAGLTVAAIAGSPLGTWLGQHAGWPTLYWTVAGVGGLAWVALALWVPRSRELDGGSVTHELRELRRGPVWVMVVVASAGISSIFAVYTFIGPFVTDAAGRPASLIPVALAVFGVGMAVGNAVGGRVADRSRSLGLLVGFAVSVGLLVVIGLAGGSIRVLLPCLFGVGAFMMLAVPTIQVRLTDAAPDAPTLMGALNLASLNLANSLGAIGGAVVLDAGGGTLSTVWAGVALTSLALLVFLVATPRRDHDRDRSPSSSTAVAAAS